MIAFFVQLSQIIVFIINATGLSLAITVWLSKVDRIFKYIFGAMIILMFFWVDFAFFARVTDQDDSALLFVRIAWAITPALFVLIYYFLLRFFEIQRAYSLITKILTTISVLFFIVILFTDTIINNIYYDSRGVLGIDYGILVWFFFGFITLMTAINFYVLIKQSRKPKQTDDQKLSIRFLLIGLTIFFILNAIFNIVLPVFFNVVHLYEFGDYSTILFMILIAYATVRHKFFGAQVVLTTFLISFLWSFLLANAVIITQNPTQRLVNSIIFILSLPIGYLLLKYMLASLRSLDLIKQKAKEQQDMMDVLAHEVKTPMSSMLLEAEYLENNVKEIMKDRDDKVITNIAESVSAMQRSGHQGMSIVNGLLEFTRVNNKRFQLSYSNFDLVDTTKRSVETFKKMVDKQNYKIKFETNLENLSIEADQSRIQEAIEGLLTNAKKYGVDPQTGNADITVSIAQEKENAVISVKDKGIGLTAQDKKSLGQKFYRGVSQTKRTKSDLPQPGGTGLGLFMINIIMDAHQGYLSFDSEGEGKGSVFKLHIPISPPENTANKEE